MLEEVKKTPLKEAKKTLPIEEESDPTTHPDSHRKESKTTCCTHTQSTSMNWTRKHIFAHFSQRGKQTTSPNGWRSRSRKNRKFRSLDFRWTAKPQDATTQFGRFQGVHGFYATHQEAKEIVAQFIIRFQNLHRQLTRAPPEEDVKEIFLAALREPLWTTLAVVDFKTNTIDQVIDRVLNMERAQNGNHLTMRTLQQALPTEEDLWFRHAIQCMTCFNPGHLGLKCIMRTHYTLCYSKAHTIERCEYNLLNGQETHVRQIEPREEQRLEEDWFRREDRFRREDYPRYDQGHSPEYDRRKGGERGYQGYN